MKTLAYFFLCCIFLSPKTKVSAQEPDSPSAHRLLLELGGNSGFYSFNYERDIQAIWQGRLKWEAGLSILPFGTRLLVSAPMGLNLCVGAAAHKFEIGAGQLITYDLSGQTTGFIRGTGHLGYRYQPVDKRFIFKIAYTPFYSYLFNFQYEHWLGLAVGISLK